MDNVAYKDKFGDSAICETYLDLKNKCNTFDFTIYIDGNAYPVHQSVLKTSGYFNVMLKSNFVENESKTVTLTSDIITTNTMEMLLDYYYTHNLDLNEENIEKIAQAATYLDDKVLLNRCTEYYKSSINMSNVLRTYEFATIYNYKELEELSLMYLASNFETFANSDQLQFVSAKLFSNLVSSTELIVKNEHVVLKAICDWTTSDESERNQYIEELLSKLNYGNLTYQSSNLLQASFLINENLQLLLKNKLAIYLFRNNELNFKECGINRKYYGGFYIFKRSGIYRYVPESNDCKQMIPVLPNFMA